MMGKKRDGWELKFCICDVTPAGAGVYAQVRVGGGLEGSTNTKFFVTKVTVQVRTRFAEATPQMQCLGSRCS